MKSTGTTPISLTKYIPARGGKRTSLIGSWRGQAVSTSLPVLITLMIAANINRSLSSSILDRFHQRSRSASPTPQCGQRFLLHRQCSSTRANHQDLCGQAGRSHGTRRSVRRSSADARSVQSNCQRRYHPVRVRRMSGVHGPTRLRCALLRSHRLVLLPHPLLRSIPWACDACSDRARMARSHHRTISECVARSTRRTCSPGSFHWLCLA